MSDRKRVVSKTIAFAYRHTFPHPTQPRKVAWSRRDNAYLAIARQALEDEIVDGLAEHDSNAALVIWDHRRCRCWDHERPWPRPARYQVYPLDHRCFVHNANFRDRVIKRLAGLYKAWDERTPQTHLDLSYLSEDELDDLQISIEFHRVHGLHQPRKKRRVKR